MIPLLLALALTNMPPPHLDDCKGKDAGVACTTRRWTDGTCVHTKCPKTEVSKTGAKQVLVDCFECRAPSPDGGTK